MSKQTVSEKRTQAISTFLSGLGQAVNADELTEEQMRWLTDIHQQMVNRWSKTFEGKAVAARIRRQALARRIEVTQ